LTPGDRASANNTARTWPIYACNRGAGPSQPQIEDDVEWDPLPLPIEFDRDDEDGASPW
jgi:hypothetical protein